MKSSPFLRTAAFLSLAAGLTIHPLTRLHAQAEPAPAEPALAPAEPALPEPALPDPAKKDAPVVAAPETASAMDTWLSQPTTAAVPLSADIEKYLAGLQQRQDDLAKTLDFLVERKRLRAESAAKESATAAIPSDLTAEHWNELAKQRQEGSLSAADYAADLSAFAAKFRTLDAAQLALSHKCAELMLQPEEEARPKHHPRPKPAEPAPSPAAPVEVAHIGRATPPPQPGAKPGTKEAKGGKTPAAPATPAPKKTP